MRRRSKAGSESAKARRRKAEMPKRRNATTMRRRPSSAEAQETKSARLARERDEALEQLSATSEVLKLISASAGELEPVLAQSGRHNCADECPLSGVKQTFS